MSVIEARMAVSTVWWNVNLVISVRVTVGDTIVIVIRPSIGVLIVPHHSNCCVSISRIRSTCLLAICLLLVLDWTQAVTHASVTARTMSKYKIKLRIEPLEDQVCQPTMDNHSNYDTILS